MRTRTVLASGLAAAAVAAAVGAGVWQPAFAAESPYYVDPDTQAAKWVAANPSDPRIWFSYACCAQW